MLAVSLSKQTDRPSKQCRPAERLQRCQLSSSQPRLTRGLVELVVVLGLLELIIWFLHGLENQLWSLLATAVVMVVGGLSVHRTRGTAMNVVVKTSLGIAWRRVGLVTVAAAALLLAYGATAGNLDASDLWQEITRRPVTHWILVKTPTVLAQQVGLQLFLLPLCLEVFRRKLPAVLFCAGAFALLHLPNPLLMLITLLAGAVWCWAYLCHGRLVPVVVSHLLLAVLAASVAEHELYHLRVGPACVSLLPETVHASDGSTISTDPQAVQGFVCRFKARGSQVVCTGWMLDCDTKEMPDKLVVLAQSRFHTIRIQERRPRPEVVDFFNDPDLLLCGYCVKLPRAWFRDTPPRFFGEAHSGAISELAISAKEKLR